MPTNRRVTQEQFSQGTTVDGNRLDRALQGVQDTVNALGPGDLVRRHHAQQYVSGWQPAVKQSSGEFLSSFPFMRILNTSGDVLGGVPPNTTIQNPYRVKGSFNPGIDPSALTANVTQYVWTQMWAFTDPVILAGVSLWMCGDTAYPNNFVYGANTPGHTAGQSITDLLVEISVASPSNPEVTVQGALAYHKLGFKAATEDSGDNPSLMGVPDMLPAHPTGPARGYVAVADLDLNRPLPRDSRIRVSVLIPQYMFAGAGTGAWLNTTYPWQGQTYSMTLTTLEPTHS